MGRQCEIFTGQRMFDGVGKEAVPLQPARGALVKLRDGLRQRPLESLPQPAGEQVVLS